jgi:carbamoyl-phosphate synthase small subunit
MIGNYGWNIVDDESRSPAVEAVLLNEACGSPNHYQSEGSMEDYLYKNGIPGLAGIDTRALVKKIRQSKTLRAKITMNPDTAVFTAPPVTPEESLVKSVSVKGYQYYGDKNDPHVVLMDYGYKSSILNALLEEGCSVTVAPYTTTFEEVERLSPDGVLFSNGPGDPLDLKTYFPEILKITKEYSSLGICLGHQLIALAYGGSSEKMLFGHRGSNHPVKHLPTGKVSMSSQNHGYVVTSESIDTSLFEPLFINVNDKSIEGIQHRTLPVKGVQFHPEAHPGPSDTHFIFKDFVRSLTTGGRMLCQQTI